jgi:3-deoxy-D-manno-octulosonate 8-phosphate phosphatase (KDO 8-P phosphatase)
LTDQSTTSISTVLSGYGPRPVHMADFSDIDVLALDFDGVMTDGNVYIDRHGEESVRVSRHDGMGIRLLMERGVHVCVITSEEGGCAYARCDKLGIPCYHAPYLGGADSKILVLRCILEQLKKTLNQTAYIGDDVNDIEVLCSVGVSITVPDGHVTCLDCASYVTFRRGGHGAVREVADFISYARQEKQKC